MSNGPWRWFAVAAVVVCGLTTGCGVGVSEPVASQDHDRTMSEESPPPVEGRHAIRGLCVVGHEVRTFIPCGSKGVYWIQADQESLDAFQTALERFTDEPYEPFFAEIDGRLSDEIGDGFAADYDGQFFVERLIRLAPASELDCDQ